MLQLWPKRILVKWGPMADAAKTMISLTQARSIVIGQIAPAASQLLPLADCANLVLAEDIAAQHDQPWAALSAMDGYAVRLADCAVDKALHIIGESRAGQPFTDAITSGAAVAISTGAAVPDGADHIVMVEQTECDGDRLHIMTQQSPNGFIRRKGQDFASGDMLLRAGQVMTAAHIALAAAAGRAACSVLPRPKIAVLTNGDELLDPGAAPRVGCLYDSNGPALTTQCNGWGGDAQWLGRAGDDKAAVAALMEGALSHDIVIIAGGASVGQHDHVRSSFAALGGVLHFSKIALRPGKPAWFGMLRGTPVIGLPGNPASAFVTAELLVRPGIQAFLGQAVRAQPALEKMQLNGILHANGPREGFLRGLAERQDDNSFEVTPAADQDSSLLQPLAAANVLIHRLSAAPAAEHGDIVNCYILQALKTHA